MKTKRLSGILISLLGVAFILWGTMSAALGFFGEEATAYVTYIRREGGERSDGRPGHYTYITSYTFTSLSGKKIDGFARNIGDGAYVKADGTSTVQIRYFNQFPFLNAIENDTGLCGGPLILILVGGVLILLMAPKHGAGP
jgi:hypothetical protein